MLLILIFLKWPQTGLSAPCVMTSDNLLILLDIQAAASRINFIKAGGARNPSRDLSVLQGFIFQTRSGWDVRTRILTCVEVEERRGIVQDNPL